MNLKPTSLNGDYILSYARQLDFDDYPEYIDKIEPIFKKLLTHEYIYENINLSDLLIFP